MADGKPPTTSSWIASDRPIARLIARPFRDFLDTEISGGIVLLVATAVALIWANSPFRASYDALWHTELSFRIGAFELAESLQHWVNDALMAVFFFVVGLEVKRELALGELSHPKKAAFPSIAALGGMVVPALIYVALNFGGEGSAGWGIPMATDIAFALGVLALFGSRVHPSLKVFLLSLAVADDIGAIVVIALFYTSDLNPVALVAAAGLLGAIVLLRAVRVEWIPLYVLVGAGAWLATFESGVHATIAGVALGLLTPVHPRRVRTWRLRTHERVAVAEHLEHLLHPWSSFVIIPIFALANAGVSLSGEDIGNAVSSPVTLGIVAGLVVGKIVGVTLFAYAAQRLGFAEVPEGLTPSQLLGVAALAGIGFTVSLFITELAFDEASIIDEAKVGILVASILAALVGALILRLGGGARSDEVVAAAREDG